MANRHGFVVRTLAGSGEEGQTDGDLESCQFLFPQGLASDSHGNIYIRDGRCVRRISPEGQVLTIFGQKEEIGANNHLVSLFRGPLGIAVDFYGNLLLVDTDLRAVTRVDVTTGSCTPLVTSKEARYSEPSGFAIDVADNIYVSDWGTHMVYKVDIYGTVSTVAGCCGESGLINGDGTQATFHGPRGLGLADNDHCLYVADTINDCIRKINLQDNIVSTIAGKGAPVELEPGFSTPVGLAVDGDDNLYIADYWNHVIRKISPTGDVTVIAGTMKKNGYKDGMSRQSLFSRPTGLCIDIQGNLLVADSANRRIRLIEIRCTPPWSIRFPLKPILIPTSTSASDIRQLTPALPSTTRLAYSSRFLRRHSNNAPINFRQIFGSLEESLSYLADFTLLVMPGPKKRNSIPSATTRTERSASESESMMDDVTRSKERKASNSELHTKPESTIPGSGSGSGSGSNPALVHVPPPQPSGTVFVVHKCILAARSPYFKQMFQQQIAAQSMTTQDHEMK